MVAECTGIYNSGAKKDALEHSHIFRLYAPDAFTPVLHEVLPSRGTNDLLKLLLQEYDSEPLLRIDE